LRLKAFLSHPEGRKACRQAEAVRRNSPAQASRCAAGPTTLGLPRDCLTLRTTTQGPEAWFSNGVQAPPLQSPPHSCSLSPKVSGRRKSSNSKAQTAPALAPGLLFAPRIGHAAIRTRLAICRAPGESQRDLGSSQWPPDQAERQTAETLPTTALPRCPQQSPHGRSGQGLPGPPLLTQEPRDRRMLRGEDAELLKNPLRHSSRAKRGSWPLPACRAAAAESPPACPAALESRNGDGLFQRHNSRCCSVGG